MSGLLRLVPNVGLEEDSPTSSQSGSERPCGKGARAGGAGPEGRASSGEDDEDDDGLRPGRAAPRGPAVSWAGGERRRRKLPEIPKNKKCK